MRNSTEHLLAAATLGLAAVNFFAGLGSSSLHVDEGLSWGAASAPLGEVVERVSLTEISPPLHYLALHEVIGRVSDSEVAMRLPSAVAGLALVGAVMWLGWRVAGERAGLFAGALAAVSPFVLEFSQQARAYVFVMLACTLAACSTMEVEKSPPGSRSRAAWLAVGGALIVVAMLLHYTAAFVVAPLVLLTLRLRMIAVREALLLATAVVVPALLLLPLVADQTGKGLEQGVDYLGRLSVANAVEVIGAPFMSRAADYGLTPAGAVGAVAVACAAIVALVVHRRRGALRGVVLPLALITPATLLVLTAVGPNSLMSRYAAVAAPFMIVLVGAAVAVLPRRVGVVLAGAAAVCAGVGSIASHLPDGHYPDVRGATNAVAAGRQPGDGVVPSGVMTFGSLYDYYAREAGIVGMPVVRGAEGFSGRPPRRLWLLQDPPQMPEANRTGAAAAGYRVVSTRLLPARSDIAVVLVTRTRAERQD